jgi:hypothetical protein
MRASESPLGADEKRHAKDWEGLSALSFRRIVAGFE